MSARHDDPASTSTAHASAPNASIPQTHAWQDGAARPFVLSDNHVFDAAAASAPPVSSPSGCCAPTPPARRGGCC